MREHIEWCHSTSEKLYGKDCTCPGFEYYDFYIKAAYTHEQAEALALATEKLISEAHRECNRRGRD